MESSLREYFLAIVRLGIGHQSRYSTPQKIDWKALETLAENQGLSAVMVDGVEKQPENERPPKPVL